MSTFYFEANCRMSFTSCNRSNETSEEMALETTLLGKLWIFECCPAVDLKLLLGAGTGELVLGVAGTEMGG